MEKFNFRNLQTQVIGCGPHKPQTTAISNTHETHAFFQCAPSSSSVSNSTTLKQNSMLSNATVMSN